jgi:hypothetical protein
MNLRWSLPELSPRDRRTLVIGTSAIAAIILVAKGVPAWIAWKADAVAGATELVGDARQADREISMAKPSRDSLRVRLARARAADSLLVPGATPAAAAAALASLLADAAEDAGVKRGMIEPHVDSASRALGSRAPRVHEAYTAISARGEITGDVVGLAQFLADLERGPRLIAVRTLSVTQAEPAARSEQMETLHVQFTVAALTRSRPAT